MPLDVFISLTKESDESFLKGLLVPQRAVLMVLLQATRCVSEVPLFIGQGLLFLWAFSEKRSSVFFCSVIKQMLQCSCRYMVKL